MVTKHTLQYGALLTVLTVLLCLPIFFGCGSAMVPEEGASMESVDIESGESVVIEEDTEDMIVFRRWWTNASSSGTKVIRVQHPDNNTVFECKPYTGRLQRLVDYHDNDDEKNLSVKSGGEFRWMDGNNYPRDESYSDHDFIEIVLKTGQNIIGYAVIDILERNYERLWDALVLKSVLFPRADGEYQNVSEEYVKTAIEKVKRERLIEKGAGGMVKPLEPSWVSVPGIPAENAIKFEYSDSSAVFECSVDNGQFAFAQNSPKNLFVLPGDAVYWQPDPGGETERAFVEIVLRINDNITGYAAIIIVPDRSGYNPTSYGAGVIRSALFPQIGGEYQKASEEYVYAAFEAVKTQWRKTEKLDFGVE
jgi:hypothetical protein